MEFLDIFDEILAKDGPPAVFTLNYEGCLQFDLLRSRDMLRQNPHTKTKSWCHCVAIDNSTGWPQYLLLTSPDLCTHHERASFTIFSSYEEALSFVDTCKRELYERNRSC